MKHLLLLLLVLASCSKKETSSKLEDLPLNKIQLIGSHNSYKQAIDSALFSVIKEKDSSMASHLDYSHISLSEQLSLGLLNLEIDFYADTTGGKYAHPNGLKWAGKDAKVSTYDPDSLMKQPGFKVFHVQDLDFRSNCLTLEKCLLELRDWSDTHKGHNPVFITMNAKDDTIDKPGFSVPEKFTSGLFDALDALIVKTLGAEKIITPDSIRGDHATLQEAVLNGGWPAVSKAKGKFIFILDEGAENSDRYRQGHPSLTGRVLFTNAEPGQSDAAIVILNDPDKDFSRIQEYVKKGYIIRTRADAETREARNNDTTRFVKACASGAQIVTTDYYQVSTHFPSTYSVKFKEGGYLRKNPLF